MSTPNKSPNNTFLGLALLAAASSLLAQTSVEARSSVKVNLPVDSPIALISADWGESRTSERGSALVLHLNTALLLRNSGQRRIRGLTLLVRSGDSPASDATPGAKASVTKVSLDVAPGETFPVRVDLRLMRPLDHTSGPAVEISLDGVLFDDLNFYGPNRLDSRRVMLAFELEAQRDRRHYLQVLREQGPEGLRKECVTSLARQAETPRLDVEFARGRATAAATSRLIQFSFLRFPDAPLDLVAGMAQVSGAEAREPRLEVVNRGQNPVTYIEVGWLLRDNRGRELLAGAVPAKTYVRPGQRMEVLGQNSLRFSETSGPPLSIESMTGFISQVEFADGSIWIPRRGSVADARLQKTLSASPEEQRLTNLYRKKGLPALIEDLRRLGSPASH